MTPTSSSSCAERPEAASGAGPGRPLSRGRLTAAGLGFVALVGGAMAWRGVFLSRDWLFAWVLVALLALSHDDLRRWWRGVLFDWLPLMALLVFYDLSDAVRELVGIRPHVLPQLDVDLALPGRSVPTVELQHALYSPAQPRWWDFAALVVYLSHFFVTLAVLVGLWRFAHPEFRRLRGLVIGLATAGFLTYVLFPAVPPWLAAWQGQLPPVHRIVGDLWAHVGVAPAMALWQTNPAFYNDVAAIPSLHAAYPVLLALFFWGRGRWVRLGLSAYVLLMAVTLVYTGEHYVSDIVVGWAYAGAVFAAVTAARRRWPAGLRAQRRSSPYDASAEPARASS